MKILSFVYAESSRVSCVFTNTLCNIHMCCIALFKNLNKFSFVGSYSLLVLVFVSFICFGFFSFLFGHFLNCHAVAVEPVVCISHNYLLLYPFPSSIFQFSFFVFMLCAVGSFRFFNICIFIKIFLYYVQSLLIPTENDTD